MLCGLVRVRAMELQRRRLEAIRDKKERLFVPGRGWEDELPIGSGQIIATSHDRFPPKGSGGFGKSPYFAEI